MRTSSRACVVLSCLCVWALAVATASAQDVLHLRSGAVLSPSPPAAGGATAILSTRLPAGEDVLLGRFISASYDHDVVVGQVRGLVYLGTGRPGMDGCARVTMSLARLTGAAQTDVASGTIDTSILARRKVVDPIVVPMLLSDSLVAATGDRLVVEVRVANQCGGARSVALLYDSVGRASSIELYATGATTSTTTTTTLLGETSTSTSMSMSTTTTSTLPPTCLEVASGLAGVRCRLEAMDAIIRGSSPASLGGPRFAGRVARRVDRALTFVRAAEVVEATPRRLRKARRQLARFVALIAHGRGDGRVDRDVGDPLGSLATGAMAGLDSLATEG